MISKIGTGRSSLEEQLANRALYRLLGCEPGLAGGHRAGLHGVLSGAVPVPLRQKPSACQHSAHAGIHRGD